MNEQQQKIDSIIEMVANYYNVTEHNLKCSSRERKYADPRHVAAYCLRQMLGISFPKIGKILGDRTHRTIIYAVDKVKDWRDNPKLNDEANKCIQYVIDHMDS